MWTVSSVIFLLLIRESCNRLEYSPWRRPRSAHGLASPDRGPPATRELGEVATAVPVKGGPPSETAPAPPHVLEGLGPGPLLEGLLADRKERRTTTLSFRAHGATPLRRRHRGGTCPDGSSAPKLGAPGRDRRPETPTRTERSRTSSARRGSP